MYSTPINRSASPHYGIPAGHRPSDAQNYYGSPMAPVPVRPSSRAPSPMMPIVPLRPISRASSPIPPGMPRSDIRRVPSTSDFHIEKAPKSPGPYGRPTTMPQADGYNRDDLIYRQQVAALIAAKDRQIATTGRIPARSAQFVLFFRAKVGSVSSSSSFDSGSDFMIIV